MIATNTIAKPGRTKGILSGKPSPVTVPPVSTPAPIAPTIVESAGLQQISDGVSADRPARARKPFGSHTQKLAYPAREGYHRHWFNDTRARIMRAGEAGYEHVKDHTGKNVETVVGVSDGGEALHAFLMEIPEEYYKEDMAAEQLRIDEMDKSIRRGADTNGEPGKDGRYIPVRGIKIGAR